MMLKADGAYGERPWFHLCVVKKIEVMTPLIVNCTPTRIGGENINKNESKRSINPRQT